MTNSVVTSIAPTQSQVLAALRGWLLSVFPSMTVVAAQANRAAEPATPSFVVMSPLSFIRRDTNLDTYADCVFTGSASGKTLQVTAMRAGSHPILPNSLLYGVNVNLAGVLIVSQASGTPGGAGAYNLSQAVTVGPETLSAGTEDIQLNSEMTVQLDFHSADFSASEAAETASALFRDDVAIQYFKALPAPSNQIWPLYADNPNQRPFLNAEQQYEWRWCLDVCMQVNQVVAVSQQFADEVEITRVPVDAFYQ